MRRVIVESPFRPLLEAPTDFVRRAMRDSLGRGEAPFASHVLYPGALDDGKPDERALGIAAGLEWGEVALATVVYTDMGISVGMALGIARALEEGRPVELRALERHDAVPAFERILRLNGGTQDDTVEGLRSQLSTYRVALDASARARREEHDKYGRRESSWCDRWDAVAAALGLTPDELEEKAATHRAQENGAAALPEGAFG